AVGNTYFKLGILDEAHRHIRKAVALLKASPSLGPPHEQTLAAQELLAWLLVSGLNNGAEGEPLLHETLHLRREVLGPASHDTLDSMDTYGTSLAIQRKYQEVEKIYRECLALRERVLGTNSPDFLVTLGNLALTLAERGDLAVAEPVVR